MRATACATLRSDQQRAIDIDRPHAQCVGAESGAHLLAVSWSKLSLRLKRFRSGLNLCRLATTSGCTVSVIRSNSAIRTF